MYKYTVTDVTDCNRSFNTSVTPKPLNIKGFIENVTDVTDVLNFLYRNLSDVHTRIKNINIYLLFICNICNKEIIYR